MLRNKIENTYIKIFRKHQWFIVIKRKNANKWLRLKQPKNISRADPFLVYDNGKYFVFFEEFDIKERHGYLCVGELNEELHIIEKVSVLLRKKYHLSFPNVFLYNNEYYMIPESSENNSIDLYKFIEFPRRIQKLRTLIDDVNAADSVVLFKNNLCYLFTSLYTGENCLHSKNLSIFQTSDLLNGSFKQLHNNPVETKQAISRMGGQFVLIDNRLFRVAQDCSIRYGYAVNIMEVKELTEYNYSEVIYKTILPPFGYMAFHTYNTANDLEIADAKVASMDVKMLLSSAIGLVSKVLKRIFNGLVVDFVTTAKSVKY